jgi:RNA polymerase sigma factor for flagellar operon FliA
LPSSSRDAIPDALTQKQMLTQVVSLIAKLPEKQQLVLALHYQDDLSYREIAQVLDLTAGRISQLHTQAMIQIRAWLQTH